MSVPPFQGSSPRQRALLALLREATGERRSQELRQRLPHGSMRHGLASVFRNLPPGQRTGLVRCRKVPNGESVHAPLERDDQPLSGVSCGHSAPLPISSVKSADLGLSKVVPQGCQPLVHPFEIHGLCRSRQQSEPLAHG